MRTEELTAGWLAQGRVPGAGVCDVRREVALPFLLADLRDACGREGLFLRAWELSREVARPAEPPRSHAERVLLTLDGVLGAGELFIGGKARGRLRPHMEVDLSEDLRGGPCRVALRFAPHLPRLYPGERGRELPVESKLLSARVRSVYRLRIEGVEVRGNLARVRLFAYGAGRVRLCLRLLAGEELLSSENVEVPVQVGSQVVERPVDRKGHAFAVLRVRADLAGEGCDEAEGFCGPEGEAHAFAHFFARPDEAMLQAARRAGFDAAALHVYPYEALLRACADERKIDLILTTGGTGLSPRDVTPEATADVLEREIRAIPVAMWVEGLKVTPNAMLSRAVAGTRGSSLIVNLPGSEKAARENLAAVLGALEHALHMIAAEGHG